MNKCVFLNHNEYVLDLSLHYKFLIGHFLCQWREVELSHKKMCAVYELFVQLLCVLYFSSCAES